MEDRVFASALIVFSFTAFFLFGNCTVSSVPITVAYRSTSTVNFESMSFNFGFRRACQTYPRNGPTDYAFLQRI